MEFESMQSKFVGKIDQIKQIDNEIITQSEPQFVEEFSIDSMTDFNLDLDLEALISEETLQTSIPIIPSDQTIVNQTPTLDFKPMNQINALNSKFDQSSLYSNDVIASNMPQVITDVKSKTGSGIKIVK